jgi:hypothetical protein
MSEPFDPYHKWLAIPPQDQPPHHYRLLGITDFESDADVIDAAANQRMSYLQDMAAGPHQAESQKLLNEIASARRCLLNVETKSTYDAELQARQPIPAVAAPADEPAVPDSKESAEKTEAEKPEASQGLPPFALISAASLGLLSIIVAVALLSGMFSGGDDEEEPNADIARLKVKWKLDEREGAHVMIDSGVIADGPSKLPESEVVTFELEPGNHKVILERAGHKPIQFRYRFLPGESKNLELRWRKR